LHKIMMEIKMKNCIISGVLFILMFIIPGCLKKKNFEDESKMLIGVKLYHINRGLDTLFNEWEEMGINTVFASPSVFGEEFNELAKEHTIKTYMILPVFYDPTALEADPDLYAITDQGEKAIEEWVEFVCPSREAYRKQKIEYIKKLISELDPDGISLDFIRYFSFWEKVYPDRHPDSIPNTCFCPHCLEKFQSEKQIDIPDSVKDSDSIAGWIQTNHSDDWIEWKCGIITSMVEDIVTEAKKIKPEIKVNLHVVPWRQDDFKGAIRRIVAQDFSAISKYADIISPMTYAHMVKREPSWINSVVIDIEGQTDCLVIPSIQVNKAYLTEPVTLEEFEQTVIEALKPPSSGVFFWSWEQLESRPEKKEVLKRALSSVKE
jgi:hypothetical protein